MACGGWQALLAVHGLLFAVYWRGAAKDEHGRVNNDAE
jgi:hypothetical protein